MGEFLRFEPLFLSKIWGGENISKMKNWEQTLPSNCGEVWLVSDVKNQETIILGKNFTLNQLIKWDENNNYFSPDFREKYQQFPLLIKIIDAQEDLSIQVHPNDELALAKHGCLGKTESWVIFQHEPEASLFLGWKKEMNSEKVRKASLEGWIDQEINQIKVQKNDLFFIPAGLVHSIGKGIVLGEIQQTSDVTYRLFDFNRKDEKGQLRELHLEDSLEAMSFDQYSETRNSGKEIVSNYFSYSIFQLNENEEFEVENHQLIWVIEGENLHAKFETNTIRLEIHEPVWIPHSFKNVKLKSENPVTFLLIKIP